MPLSIRSLLMLLLMSVLLPALLAACWLVASTVDVEREKNTRLLQEAAQALSLAVDREFSRRATLAHVLALSPGLDAADGRTPDALEGFGAQARAALQGQAGWVELWGREGKIYDSRWPTDGSEPEPRSRGIPVRPLSDVPALRSSAELRPGAAAASAAAEAPVALLEPVRVGERTVFNVAVMLPLLELRRLVDALPLAPGWTAAVVDAQGRVMALHPSAGSAASARLGGLAFRGDAAVFETTALDGSGITGRFQRSDAGWYGVVALPSAALTGDWPAAARRFALAALLLLVLAAAASLWLARRIAQPLQALTEAARRLHNGLPVNPARTGIAECDEVAAALSNASEAIRHSRAELEQQVGAAVARTRMAEQVRAHGQRVEALGRLTGGVAHDFNNLLGIISNSNHLMQRHPAAAELQAPLRATQQAVQTGSQLTQHLLRFAGRRPTRPQRLHLAQWLPEVRDLMASVAGARIDVVAEVDAGTPPVQVDPAELELALLNLMLNARDAMPTGGQLRLHACKASDDGVAGPRSAMAEDQVLITIADDGIGIEEDRLRRLFEPFYTTKAVGKGSGLGLSQVLGFCKQAGGTAWVDSTAGIGTTVSMLLPAAAPPAPGHAADREHGSGGAPAPLADGAQGLVLSASGGTASGWASAALAGARVLLVEDNRALAETTEALLRSHGAQVRVAVDAADALEQVDSHSDFDVVLSDVVMPGAVDGLGLARQLQQRQPGLPVLLISGHNQTAAAVPQEFVLLRKPCPPDELLGALRRAIATRPRHPAPAA